MSVDLREFDPSKKKRNFTKKQRDTNLLGVLGQPEPEMDDRHTKLCESLFGSYDRMLDLFYQELHRDDHFNNLCQRKSLPVPNVVSSGTTRIVWQNFGEICQCLDRDIDHVMKFVLIELGTDGSKGQQNRLTIRGRFRPTQLISILKKYISEYVTCPSCSSPNTNFTKENRINFLRCKDCGANHAVSTLTGGYKFQRRN